MTDLMLIALIALLEPTRGMPGEHLAVARAAAEVCNGKDAWPGAECTAALLAIAREESSLRAAPGRRWGAGAWQVQPGRPFRWQGMKLQTPRASELEHPFIGAKWALRILETKWRYCDGSKDRWRCTFRWYNGSDGAKAYARRVDRRFRALRGGQP